MLRQISFVAIGIVLIGACSGSASETNATTEVTRQEVDAASSEATSLYENFVTLSRALGGLEIAADDAAVRAALLCSGAAEDMFGGLPLEGFPTDLALVRTYCPDVEGDYGPSEPTEFESTQDDAANAELAEPMNSTTTSTTEPSPETTTSPVETTDVRQTAPDPAEIPDPAESDPENFDAPESGTSTVPESGSSEYERFLALTAELGGDVIAEDDAAIRAFLLCSGAALEMFGGLPLATSPTDLALVRSYCPAVEADYG